MPFKTKYGTHYHMTEGCCGATEPCDTKGLTPCSICCGKGQGMGATTGGDTASGVGTSIPAGTTIVRGPRGEVAVDGTVIEKRRVGAGISPMADGTLYRLDTNLPIEQQKLLDRLPSIQVLPNEFSLDMTNRTTAMIVYDAGPDYQIEYAQTIGDLGIKALGNGFSIDADSMSTEGIAAWLASNKENEWETSTVPYRIDPNAEPTHVDNGYGDTYMRYPIVPVPDGAEGAEYVPQWVRRLDGISFAYDRGDKFGNHRKLCAILVRDGYEAIAREVNGQTRIGVRKHYDQPIMRDMSTAKWAVTRSDGDGDSVEASGVAYRTPAGDARIVMSVRPDPAREGKTRTSIMVEDPYLGETVSILSDEPTESMEDAKGEVCQRELNMVNLGARMGPYVMRQAYERNLTGIARKHMESEGMDIEGVTRLSRTEVEVRCLEGGYVPVRRRIKLTREGKIESYAK